VVFLKKTLLPIELLEPSFKNFLIRNAFSVPKELVLNVNPN
jgi:hypothetical protein